MNMKGIICVNLLLTGFYTSSVNAINLTFNGDFETPAVINLATGFDTYYRGQNFGGWTVGGDSIDLVSDNLVGWVAWKAASGHQSVDLSGWNSGSIYQDLSTVEGQIYYLSFAMAGNTANAPSVVQMNFYWGSTLVKTLSFNTIRNRFDPGWTYYEFELQAPTDKARLVFESLVGGSGGPSIDDVMVRDTPRFSNYEPLPEPSPLPDPPSHIVEAIMLLPLVIQLFRNCSNHQKAVKV